MSPAQALSGQILTEQGFVSGRLLHTDRITAIEPGPAPAQFILPGFIDLHVQSRASDDTLRALLLHLLQLLFDLLFTTTRLCTKLTQISSFCFRGLA